MSSRSVKYKVGELHINSEGKLMPYQGETEVQLSSVEKFEREFEQTFEQDFSSSNLPIVKMEMGEDLADFFKGMMLATDEPTGKENVTVTTKLGTKSYDDEKNDSNREIVPYHARQTSFLPIREAQLQLLAEKHNIKGAHEHLKGPNGFVYNYLLERDSEFRRVAELRAKGWENPVGDEIFIKSRHYSDHMTPDQEKAVFRKMIEIAYEMHKFRQIYAPQAARGRSLKVLDICMAPGGYSAVAFKLAYGAEVYGITLPEGGTMGGHEVFKEVKDRMKGIIFNDLTMFAREFTDRDIPKNHPDYENFSPLRPFIGHKFHLVFCDGNVLRTHQRPEYRKERELEQTRLNNSQLILGMQRILPGGNLIMLLQKIDYWHNIYLIWQFSKFSKISVLKSSRAFVRKGSFMLIAQDVQPEHPKAKEAIAEWKEDWWRATCGGENGTGEPKSEPDDTFIEKVLNEFGDKLMEMSRPVWKIQADALERSSYAGDGSNRSDDRREPQLRLTYL